jgi:hypothetical protein
MTYLDYLHGTLHDVVRVIDEMPDAQDFGAYVQNQVRAIRNRADKLMSLGAALPQSDKMAPVTNICLGPGAEWKNIFTLLHILHTTTLSAAAAAPPIIIRLKDDDRLATRTLIAASSAVMSQASKFAYILTDLIHLENPITQTSQPESRPFILATKALSTEIARSLNTLTLDNLALNNAIRAREQYVMQSFRCLCREIVLHDPNANGHVSAVEERDSVVITVSATPYNVPLDEIKRLLTGRSTHDVFNVNLYLARTLTEIQSGTFDYAFEEGITFMLRFPMAQE